MNKNVSRKMLEILTPIDFETVKDLSPGDAILISGYIFTGRDAVLPRLVDLIQNNELGKYGINLDGAVIFHTAVSLAGIGPTSSNKVEIEESIPKLSAAGVKMHLGKGILNNYTVKHLKENDSVYAIVAPVTALLQSTIKEKRVVAFPEEGMEALHLLKVENLPAVVAVANGKTIW